ncbi:MAG: cytochrome P450 [Acidimicrobiales bacterium]|nr:cytochrome P450 [Acidimicrobiales bacterium]
MTSPDELALKILMDPAAIPDPHPLYKQLRETAPLFKTGIGDMWIVSGFENCRALLRDPRVGSPDDSQGTVSRLQGTEVTPRTRERQNRTMLFLNPPDHTRIRSLVSRAFTPRRVEQLRPEITAMTDALLDDLGGEGDFVDAVAFPLPANVISALVGVPESKRDWLRSLITDLVPMIEPTASDEAIAKADVAGTEAAAYLTELMEERRAEPQNDMLSALIQASDGEDRLTEEEVISNVFLIYAAGFETTTHLLGNMVRQLAANPDQLARVRDDRSLIPNAVEEVLRFDPPVQLDGRYVFEDIEIDGVTIEAGNSLITFLAGANRDPAVCDDPDTFDVGRDDIQIMSFGSGIHYCLGAALARLEGQVVLERLVDRYGSWEITAEPVWQPRITIRGVERLDVKFT